MWAVTPSAARTALPFSSDAASTIRKQTPCSVTMNQFLNWLYNSGLRHLFSLHFHVQLFSSGPNSSDFLHDWSAHITNLKSIWKHFLGYSCCFQLKTDSSDDVTQVFSPFRKDVWFLESKTTPTFSYLISRKKNILYNHVNVVKQLTTHCQTQSMTHLLKSLILIRDNSRLINDVTEKEVER